MPAITQISPIRLTGAYLPAGLELFNSNTAVRLKACAGSGLITRTFPDSSASPFTSNLFQPWQRTDGFESSTSLNLWMQYVGAAVGTIGGSTTQRRCISYVDQDDMNALGDGIYRALVRADSTSSVGLALCINPANGTCYIFKNIPTINFIYFSKYETPATETLLGSVAFAFDASTYYHIKVWKNGTTFKIKVWKTGTAEPTTGGPTGDGYNLTVVDATYSSGYIGLWGFGAINQVYASEFEHANYDTTSPTAYLKYDPGYAGSTWAAGITTKENIQSFDDATALNYKVFYSDTSYDVTNAGDRLIIDAGLSANWVTAANVPGGTGRYRYLVAQFVSNGTVTHSLAIYDDGQSVTLNVSSGGMGGINAKVLAGGA